MMLSASAILSEIQSAGGEILATPEGKIRYRLPDPAEADRLEPAIRARKTALLMLLRSGADAHDLPDPFGPLPADPGEAESELALRQRLREPALARLTVGEPVDGGGVGALVLCSVAAASVIWAEAGPESVARRRAASWDGCPPPLLADRRISFRPAPGALAIGEWVRLPGSHSAEVLAHDADSADVLTRTLAEPPRWTWFRPGALVGELDWPRR